MEQNEDGRYAQLLENIKRYKKPMLAFSGGTDSTFLLHALCDSKIPFMAVTAATPFIPMEESGNIDQLAKMFGISVLTVFVKDFPETVLQNDAQRCYYCKMYIFSKLKTIADGSGFDIIFDGSNLDDCDDYRPGARALAELGVKSPLQEAGFTKKNIRELSRRFNLPTWDKTANSCLAARVPYGAKISYDRLKMIDEAEMYIRSRGFITVRVRDHGDVARIEVDEKEKHRFADETIANDVMRELQRIGFMYAACDLGGYKRGNMNKGIT